MKEKTESTIAQYKMISAGETICVALSGGADSVALLVVLEKLSAKLNFHLTAVHINHLLRGEESDRDENFCRNLCAEMKIPLTVFRENAAAFSQSLGVSVETGARELRYKIFDEIPADKIATAHNLNDNAETILFRIARGTGLHGLAGIPPVRGKIIRPLILCTREEIENFLSEEHRDFVTDSTNLSDDFTRNRIRHKIIPEMAAIHSAFPECVTRMTASLTEDEDFLTQEALKCGKTDLRTLHPAIRKRVIINLLKTHKLKVTAEKIAEIEAAAMSGNGRTIVENNFFAESRNGTIRIFRSTPEAAPEPEIIRNFGEHRFNSDKTVIILKQTNENVNNIGNVNKKSTFCYADYDKIQGDIVLRNRLRSDRIKPVGAVHTKELRKILQEKLPPEERKITAVLEDEKGIIWAEYAGFSDRVKADEKTENFILIKVEKNKLT